jgi:serine 3-dehydrogenase
MSAPVVAAGKVAFVTGATSGIGEATTRLLALKGWTVIAAGRRTERLEMLAGSLPVGSVHPLPFDIQDAVARATAIQTIVGMFGALHLLVNNAGLALGTEPAHETRLADWETMIQTNVVALVAVTHQLLPALIRGRGGIVNLSSIAATYPYSGGNVYGASKAFVRQFSLGLHCDLRGTGVRVTSLEPGMVETEFTGVRRRDPDAGRAFYAGAEALTADDMAHTILWVANLPPHMNINAIEVMPLSQTWAGFHVDRTGG